MKNKIAFLAITLAGFAISDVALAQKSDTRSVAGITAVQVRSGIDLYLSQGNTESITIEYKGIDLEDIRADIKNGVLSIYMDKKGNNWSWNWGKNSSVKVYLSFKQLNSIVAMGGSDVFSKGSLTFKDLNLNVSGGSDADLNLKAETLNVSSAGGSDTKLIGSVRNLNAESTGGSDLKAEDLEVDICKVRASGGSDAYVRANKEIIVEATGGSDVYWYGKARVVSQRSSGGSDVHH